VVASVAVYPPTVFTAPYVAVAAEKTTVRKAKKGKKGKKTKFKKKRKPKRYLLKQAA
jgi:hypothetical protein